MIDNKQINDHLDHFQNLTSQRLNYQREKYFPICSLVASNYLKFLGKMKCCFVQVAYKKNRIQQFFFKIVILINIVSDTFVSKSLTLSAEIIFYKTLFTTTFGISVSPKRAKMTISHMELKIRKAFIEILFHKYKLCRGELSSLFFKAEANYFISKRVYV